MKTTGYGICLAAVYVLNCISEIADVKQELIVVLLLSMTLDTVTGYVKAWKLKDFQSKKATLGIIFKVLFLPIPVIVAKLMAALGFEFDVLTSMVFTLLSLHEIYSALGNIYTIKTGIVTTEQDSVVLMIKWLMDRVERVIHFHEKGNSNKNHENHEKHEDDK